MSFRSFVMTLSVWAALGAASRTAAAHIELLSPPDWLVDNNGLGNEQKHQPCGDPTLAKASGKMTTFHAGDTIAVVWKEVVPHNGWFRIALTTDRSLLQEPVATVDPKTKQATDATTTKPEGM